LSGGVEAGVEEGALAGLEVDPGKVEVAGARGRAVDGIRGAARSVVDQEGFAEDLAAVAGDGEVEVVDDGAVRRGEAEGAGDVDALGLVDGDAGPAVGNAGVAAVGVERGDGGAEGFSAVGGNRQLD